MAVSHSELIQNVSRWNLNVVAVLFEILVFGYKVIAKCLGSIWLTMPMPNIETPSGCISRQC